MGFQNYAGHGALLGAHPDPVLQTPCEPKPDIRRKPAMIQPGDTFKDNLQQLPPIDGVDRVNLVDSAGSVIASIENQPGKQGSLAVYQYLSQEFGTLDAKAAEHGLAVFGEHTADARERPGVHPNVDRLLAIAAGGAPLDIKVITASR